MSKKSLPWKRALRSVLLVLLLSSAGMAKGQYQGYFEEDGLHYGILMDNPTCVAVVPPNCYGGNENDFVNLILTNPVVHEHDDGYGMQHDEYTLVSIEPFAFSGCNSLVSIEIPNSVTSIGSGAFYECTNLTFVDFPNSVTYIGGEAFYNCTSLASIEIPNSLTSIEQGTFYGCSSLTGSLTIPNSVTTIGDYAFYDCSGFTGSLTIPNSVTTIGTQAFEGCSGFTGSLTIPNSVTMIDQAAFYGCSGFTGHLTIGNSVNEIGYGAFADCSGLTSFNIPNSVRKIGGHAFHETGWYEQQPNRTVLYMDNWCLGYKGWGPTGSSLTLNEGIKAIADYAFENCDFFTGDLTIPNSVITIGMCAFRGCSGFTGSLTIPNSVTEIGFGTFSGCSGFSGSLVIPNSVTTIGSAFSGCSGFTGSLIIGNSVSMIDDYAFHNCSGFTSITSLAGTPPILKTYPNGSFYSWSNSTPVYVPCGFEGAYSSSQSWRRFFSNYYGLCGGTVAVAATPVDGGTVTGSGSFEAGEACTVTATANEGYFFAEWTQDGNRISTNSEYTFYVANDVELVAHFIEDDIIEFADDNLKAICVSHWDTDGDGELSYSEAASVKSLGNYFRNNSSLTSFDELQHFIGLSLIGDNAFSGCSGLASIVLPESITWIGSSAFNGCSGLIGRFTIPEFVTRIDYKAFYDCCNIDEIIMLNTVPPTLGTSVFCTTNPSFVIYVPYESLNAYKTANNWSNYEPYIKPIHSSSVIVGYGSSTTNDNWHFVSSPVAESVEPSRVFNMLSEESGYDLYQFDQSAEHEEWRNYKVDSFNIVNGRGYLYANAVDVNLLFGGDFNEDETMMVSLDYDAGKPFAGWNLVGNPFPAEAYIDRSYYVMNPAGSGIFPIAVSASTPIPVCTGVMVKAESAGESVVFNRMVPTDKVNLGKLQIALTEADDSRGSATIVDKTILSFNQGDALEKYVFNARNAQLYIPQEGKDYAIACVENGSEMPINFKSAKNGEYTLTINPEAVELDYLHLIDNMTGADIDLLVSPTYTFDAKTSDYASRFRLVFSANGYADGDDEAFAFIYNGDIVFTGMGGEAFNTSLQIVDVQGRVIVCRGTVPTSLSTAGMVPGVYVLRLVNGDDVRTQKLVVR